ncbi:MAG: hypothetical protein IPH07_13360 [Deltaproteobacteria bacterium]|nr:hypothetical protein [Deltaproteobacteria bacterium]MBK8716935.1 hypothetical protein [Deltaproteobacteria bacterium]
MRRTGSLLLTALLVHPLACAGGSPAPGAFGGSISAGEFDGDDGSSGAGPDAGADASVGSPPDLPVGRCGDGVQDDGEQCDDGVVDGGYGGCLADCSGPAPRCGDGEVFDARESCDAGPLGDAVCNALCRVRGEVLASVHEDSGLGEVTSLRTTWWSARPTAVFGGDSMTVWELEPAAGGTHRVRTTTMGFSHVSGAVGLDDGGLVIADADAWRIRRYDDALASTWTFDATPELVADAPGFVGMSPVGDGFAVGGRLHHHVPAYSAFYALAFDGAGALQWQQLQTLYGTADIVAYDLRGTADGRSALLTRRAGGWPGVRVFDAEGVVAADVEAPALDDVYFDLCAGAGGFYLAAFASGHLVGYAADGTPTTTVIYEPPEDPVASASACAVDDDGRALVVWLAHQDDGEVAAWVFRDDAEPLAVVPMGPGVEYSTAEVGVLLDDARAQAWIFAAGFAHPGQDTRTVAATAIAL